MLDMNKRSSKMINMNESHNEKKKRGRQTPDLAGYKKNTVRIYRN